MKSNRHIHNLLLPIVIAILMTGCASTKNEKDPLEGFNRAMFSFNETVDKVALKPAATAYDKVMPSFAQTGVGNFFGNIGDVWTAINNLLQGNVKKSASDVTRVAINSTIGLLGLIDVATEAGLPKHKEDFGQTLGVWGGKSGPYIVLPLLGPSTVRDTIALPVDYYGYAWNHKEPDHVRYQGGILKILNDRAAALDAVNLLEDAALDKYEFVRDAYLQKRQHDIHNGKPAEPLPDYEDYSNAPPAHDDWQDVSLSDSENQTK